MGAAADLIKAIAALFWPITVLVLGLVYRKDLRALMGRLKRGKFLGQELELEARAMTTTERQAVIEQKAGEALALPPAAPKPETPMLPEAKIRFRETYVEAEALAVERLRRDYGGDKVQAGVVLYDAKREMEFDAVVKLRRALLGVEIKLFAEPRVDPFILDRLEVMANHIDRAAQQAYGAWGGSLLLFAVTTFGGPDQEKLETKLREKIRERGLAVDVQVVQLAELRKAAGNEG